MKSLLVGDISSYRFHAFYDCEYTCWADSLETRWANPKRPADLFQIGIAVYDTKNKTFTEGDKFALANRSLYVFVYEVLFEFQKK